MHRYMYMHVSMYLSIYLSIYLYMYIYIYIYIYTGAGPARSSLARSRPPGTAFVGQEKST